jgi:hypothetical protein
MLSFDLHGRCKNALAVIITVGRLAQCPFSDQEYANTMGCHFAHGIISSLTGKEIFETFEDQTKLSHCP